ncbi:MAG TPA: PPA1309 family protein [Nocardioidaceae bacterium]|nr:PPA1309 family protein [Nocardioidaceae bacterium]
MPDEPVDQASNPNDTPLAHAVREIEAHAHEAGWDQPPRLYALVPTDELLAREPALGAQLGIDAGSAAGTLTPVEQEQLPPDRSLEQTLHAIMWPPDVTGCAAVLERLALPPEAERNMPEDPAEAQEYAAGHPDRHEVRMAAGVSRDGNQHCVLRVRTHEGALLQGHDLVPSLTRLLLDTLRD